MNRINMKNIIFLCSVVALLCISTASVFHIVLAWKQIEEIDIARYKKMELNAFFREKLSFIRCRFLEIEKKLSPDDADNEKSAGWRHYEREYDSIYERKKETEEEMKRCGYTTLEIETLKNSADLFGSIQLKLSNLDEYRKERKEFGFKDEEIEKEIDELWTFFSESREPFLLK